MEIVAKKVTKEEKKEDGEEEVTMELEHVTLEYWRGKLKRKLKCNPAEVVVGAAFKRQKVWEEMLDIPHAGKPCHYSCSSSEEI